MPVFEYTALNARGRNVSGILDADSAFSARQKLRASDVFPVTVDEIDDRQTQTKIGRYRLPFIGRRVKPAEVALFTRQLATLLEAGFPLVEALTALIDQARNPALRRQLSQIKDSIAAGSSFAAALEAHPGTFPAMVVNMVQAGESSGTLDLVLQRLADIQENQQILQHRITTALTYPVLMSIIGVLILFFLLTHIVPGIITIFSDMQQTLPAPTRLLIAVSDAVQRGWPVMAGLILAGLLGTRYAAGTQRGRYWIDRAVLRLPIYRHIFIRLTLGRAARTLGSLLENGVSLLVALDIISRAMGNTLLADGLNHAGREVRQGRSLGAALGTNPLFPPLLIQMIQVGEKSGDLEKMLEKTASIFEKEAETSIMRLTSLLEPLMIVAMGVVVGLIVLAVCLPIFEMNQMVI